MTAGRDDIESVQGLPPLEALMRAPSLPGCYLMRGADGAVLYIGKAKDLKARLRQYFGPTPEDTRPLIVRMLPLVAAVDLVVTGSEKEALLLENTLIKGHRPPNNLRIIDDKTYFSLVMDLGHPYPRIEVVRRRENMPLGPRVVLFGPYDSAKAARQTLLLVNRHFALRDCADSQFKGRARPCLRHQMHRCPGPCCLPVDEGDYNREVRRVRLFLEGKGTEILPDLKADMEAAARSLAFEDAARLRDTIKAVERTLQHQHVDLGETGDKDAVALYREGDNATAVVLPVRDGRVLEPGRYTVRTREETDAEVMARLLLHHYEQAPPPPELLLSHLPDEADSLAMLLKEQAGRAVSLRAPERGEGRQLVMMATRNAFTLFESHRTRLDTSTAAAQRLAKLLQVAQPPRRIECFDISIFQGAFAVGSMACFINGSPVNRLYRRWRIVGVEGMDDFAMLKEVLTRRITRGNREGDLPDLIVMDGGKGQLAQAVAVLKELSPGNPIPVIALAKARTEAAGAVPGFTRTEVDHSPERIFIPRRKDAYPLKPGTAERFLLERIRDEAHRFAIEYHRLLRSRSHLRSGLEDIPGIGGKRKKILLKHFGSLKRVREAGLEALLATPGLPAEVARSLYRHFHDEQK